MYLQYIIFVYILASASCMTFVRAFNASNLGPGSLKKPTREGEVVDKKRQQTKVYDTYHVCIYIYKCILNIKMVASFHRK